MIRTLALISAFLFVSACGVDGEPEAPQPRVNAGVTISSSGIYPRANVGVSNGPVSVNVGLGRWGWW